MKRHAYIFAATVLLIGSWYLLSRETQTEIQLGSDSGAHSPGTVADDATVGTVAWSSPDNVKLSDNVRATAAFTSPNIGRFHYLKATNFGFSIPEGATVDGIVVATERHRTGSDIIFDYQVKLVKADASLGLENKADTLTSWTGDFTDVTKTYGSSSDTWSESWTAADINDADFGVVLSAELIGTNDTTTTARVDHISITVYYTEGPAASTNGTAKINNAAVRVNSGTVIIR